MKKNLSFALALGWFLRAQAAFAASVVVFPATGSNLGGDAAESISAALAQAYGLCSQDRVIGPDRARQALARAGSPSQAATSLRAEAFIVISAVGLDTSILLSARLYRADGSLVHQTRPTAASLDEMDRATRRVACSLHQRAPKQQASGLGQIRSERADPVATKEEAPQGKGWIRDVVIGAKLGGAYRITDSDSYTPGIAQIDFDLRLDSNALFIELGAGLRLGTKINGLPPSFMIEAGASLYLFGTEHAPYVGLGAMVKRDTDSDPWANIAPYAQLGVMLFRFRSTKLFIDLRVNHDLFVHERNSGDVFRSTEIGLTAGLGG